MNVRTMPIVTDLATYNTNFATIQPNVAPAQPESQKGGIGFNYDPIPLNPRANPPAGHGGNVKNRDNYCARAGIMQGGVPKTLSGMVHIGFKGKNPMQRFHRHDKVQAGNQGSGFGTGPYRRSAVFTVSLIEPNFIFTSTENATMQTFDVRLMWGDTSEEVRGIAGNPVQFSIIASP